MEEDKIGVHRTHCCKVHGCKYGDVDCPVETGRIAQAYICEDNSPNSRCFPPIINRIEVIDHYHSKGRVLVHWDDNSSVTYQLQDEGRTLKVFIEKK